MGLYYGLAAHKTRLKVYETKQTKVGLLERLTTSYLTADDLISEKLIKLDEKLKDQPDNNLHHELVGIAVTLTSYKLKQLYGERYFQGRISDRFIEARYLSIVLKGINNTLGEKRKKPEKVRDRLYPIVEKLVKQDAISEKQRQELEKNRIYNVLAKSFTSLDPERMRENIISIGKALEGIKKPSKKEEIKKEMSMYKDASKEAIRIMETGYVAKMIRNEEEKIRDALAESLTDKFK